MGEKNVAPDARAPTFEELVSEAEELAGRMADGGLTLDQALAAYEKGTDNLRRCALLLREAEARVKVLVEKGGVFRLENFDADPGNGAEEDAE